MPEHPAAYVDQLAGELRTTRPDVVRAAENELQRLRLVLGTVAGFINNPAYDHTARADLAQALQLPAPAQEIHMVNRSKAKGTAAETAVTRFLQTIGFPYAERRTLNGTHDRGDIAGIPGVVIEVKNCAKQELGSWIAEAERERDNDNATLGVVWHKRRGKTDPADWFVTMSGSQFGQLLREQQGLPALPDTDGEAA